MFWEILRSHSGADTDSFNLLEYNARTGKQRVFKFNNEYGRMGTIINHCVATDVTTLWHVVTAWMVASSVTTQQ